MQDETVDVSLLHFAQRTGTSCNDDGKAIFTLEALHREIDNLKDKKAIGVLKRYKAALSRPLLIIFQKSFSEEIVQIQWKLVNVIRIHKERSRKLRSSYRSVSSILSVRYPRASYRE